MSKNEIKVGDLFTYRGGAPYRVVALSRTNVAFVFEQDNTNIHVRKKADFWNDYKPYTPPRKTEKHWIPVLEHIGNKDVLILYMNGSVMSVGKPAIKTVRCGSWQRDVYDWTLAEYIESKEKEV